MFATKTKTAKWNALKMKRLTIIIVVYELRYIHVVHSQGILLNEPIVTENLSPLTKMLMVTQDFQTKFARKDSVNLGHHCRPLP